VQSEFTKRFFGLLGLSKSVSAAAAADLETVLGKNATNQIATLNITDASVIAA